jgi:DNA invertase Pin-like site-specific DNA recombinase
MKDTKPKFVAYLRVSTDRQGKSGLGLEAQRTAVHQFVAQRGGEIIAPEYREIESGKVNNRPELEKAMKRCRLTGATLLVAKLDRLSRNAAFLMTLKDSGVPFVAADMPDANTLTMRYGVTGAARARDDLQAHEGRAGRC